MYNKYDFEHDKDVEYLIHLERNNLKKYKYTFLTNLFNITVI